MRNIFQICLPIYQLFRYNLNKIQLISLYYKIILSWIFAQLFCFAYLSAVWLLFWENPIELIVGKYFLLSFAQIFTKQLRDQQT